MWHNRLPATELVTVTVRKDLSKAYFRENARRVVGR